MKARLTIPAISERGGAHDVKINAYAIDDDGTELTYDFNIRVEGETYGSAPTAAMRKLSDLLNALSIEALKYG